MAVPEESWNITWKELKRMCFCNSPEVNPGGKYERVIINGVIAHWIGIGLVTEREARPSDYFLYPEVFDE